MNPSFVFDLPFSETDVSETFTLRKLKNPDFQKVTLRLTFLPLDLSVETTGYARTTVPYIGSETYHIMKNKLVSRLSEKLLKLSLF